MAALVPVWRDPAVYGEPHTAEVHPDQLDRWLARGWIQGVPPIMPDPAASPVFQCITGLLNTAWNPADIRPDRAATEGQLAELARGMAVDAKVYIATYNVTTAREIIAYLDSAAEPFAPLVVKRGNDYYTAILATRSGDDSVIVRVLGSGSGDYIVFNYTVRGSVWSNSSHTFQRKLESGTNIKTINGASLLGNGDIEVSGGNREYQLCVADTGGNVVQIGDIKIDNTDYGIFEFYYKTDALPNSTVKTFTFTNLLADYTIRDFVDATGVTSNGVFVGNGRTDNNNRLIVQQFSKVSKNLQIRTYQDFSWETATLKVMFIGSRV